MGKYKEWKEYFKEKNNNIQGDPFCFYDLEGRYLPEDKNAVILDVGCGRSCSFEEYHELWIRYNNITLLDGNYDTVNHLVIKYGDKAKVERYIAPDKLPFNDKSVDFIYCSHMIEHLYFKDTFNLIKEFDRVLKPYGILIIRSPMPWFGFYETFDHIKPYPPLTFTQYLCDLEVDSPSYTPISKKYEIKEKKYRYGSFSSNTNRIGSSNKLIDFLILGIGIILRIFSIKRYRQTGYTIILKKMR